MRDKFLKVAIIAIEEKKRQFYQQMLAVYPTVVTEPYASMHHFRNACKNKEYSGFLVDNRTLVSSPFKDKEFYSQICKVFPVLRVGFGFSEEYITFIREKETHLHLKGRQVLEYFVNSDLQQNCQHQVRLDMRKNIHFNTHLFLPEQTKGIKTNLLDISENGCFVLTCCDDKQSGDQLELKINELDDPSPITCEIKWQKDWGLDLDHLPGVGVTFIDITKHQKSQILSHLEK